MTTDTEEVWVRRIGQSDGVLIGRRWPAPDPDTMTPDDAEWVLESWSEFAAEAWQHYQREGRGAVLHRSEDLTPEGESPMCYLSARTVKASGVGWPIGGAGRMVATYDPAVQVVLAFIDPDAASDLATFDAFTLSAGEGLPTPLAAYEALQSDLEAAFGELVVVDDELPWE
jgi:hypothetical protein